MRIGKRGFQGRIKGNLQIQFGEERLTSHAGLELLRRFLGGLGFFRELASSERSQFGRGRAAASRSGRAEATSG